MEIAGVSRERYVEEPKQKRRRNRVYAGQEIKRGFWFALGMSLFFLVSGLLTFIALSVLGISLLS